MVPVKGAIAPQLQPAAAMQKCQQTYNFSRDVRNGHF